MLFSSLTKLMSATAQKVESSIRNRLLLAQKKTQAYKDKTLPELQQFFDATPTPNLIIQTYVNAEQYESISHIQDELASDTGRTNQELSNEAVHNYRYSSAIITRPIYEEYVKLLTNVNTTLGSYSIIESSPERIHDAIGEILSCLLDYAQACVDQYEQYRAMDDRTMEANLSQYLVDLSDPNVWTQSYPFDIQTLKTQFDRLVTLLENDGTYPEIVKFILNREIGSFGTAFISDLQSPILLSVLPLSTSEDLIKNIWMNRFADELMFDKLENFAPTIDDSETIKLSESIANKLSTSTFPEHRDHTIKRSFHKKSSPHNKDDDEAAGIGMSFAPSPSANPKGKKSKREKAPKGDESPRPQTQKESPQVPDDSQYEPDPLLVSKTRTMTEKIRAQAADDLSHDHMSRFSTTVEVASSISKTQLKPSDYRIQIKDRNGTRFYLVTYTRKSRKPIFSPIS